MYFEPSVGEITQEKIDLARVAMIRNAHRQHQDNREMFKLGTNIGLGVGAAGVAGLALVGAMAMSGAILPLAAAVTLQGLLGVSVAGVAMAGVSKLKNLVSESNDRKLRDAVSKLDDGYSVSSVIRSVLGGEGFASKLANFRQSKLASSTVPAPEVNPQKLGM